MNREYFEFILNVQAIAFAVVVKKFELKEKDIQFEWSIINREEPLRASGGVGVRPTKYLAFSHRPIRPGDIKELAFSGVIEKVATFGRGIVVQLEAFNQEADAILQSFLADDFLSLKNPIDYVKNIAVTLTATNDHSMPILRSFISHLIQHFPEIEDQVKTKLTAQLISNQYATPSAYADSLRTPPPIPQSNNLREWLMFRLEMMRFGVTIPHKKIGEKAFCSEDSVKQANRELIRELRDRYELTDFLDSL